MREQTLTLIERYYAAFNAVYIEYFPNDPPARAALAASGLALGALVELDCIAAAPAGT